VADDARDILELLLEDQEDFRGLFGELDRTRAERSDRSWGCLIARGMPHATRSPAERTPRKSPPLTAKGCAGPGGGRSSDRDQGRKRV
jgi:hypothetical protein